MAFDMYRAATSVYIKLEKYTDAATILLKWALAADKSNAAHSQCKKELEECPLEYLNTSDIAKDAISIVVFGKEEVGC
ncbi:gamma-soluble NSF attachment protein-like isoform X2 [Henckelia pumila]|uniref:gamma-soluble NSF attachment protein-like isoform X2 n=1 Tax=Henckelia pumila TaxID=405737 RepID=UPI003C6E316D